MSGLPATARIGFDAVRALRNSTGLGNYARHLLRGLRRAAPGLDLHLYSPSPPRPEFSGYAESIGATVHLPPPGQPDGGHQLVAARSHNVEPRVDDQHRRRGRG